MTPADFAELVGARRAGEGRWAAKCPAHEDRNASCSIREGRDGCVLVHCFAGCELDAILGAIGVPKRDLFPDSEDSRYRPVVAWRGPSPEEQQECRVRALVARLLRSHEPPEPARLRAEMAAIGRLLIGGTSAFALVPERFDPESIRTWPLRLVFDAIEKVAAQGTPRRWFSPFALAREVDFWAQRPGYARDCGLYLWCRVSVEEARWQRWHDAKAVNDPDARGSNAAHEA